MLSLYQPDSPICKDALLLYPFDGLNDVFGYEAYRGCEPYLFTGTRDELLAARDTAWLGTFLNGLSPVYDLSGPDAVKLLNRVAVNRDFAKMPVGGSRHALLCNEDGYLLSDGVIMRTDENTFRSYWVAPPLAYYAEKKAPEWGLDVTGKWVTDEFFIQIDGPKSLEIMERAAHQDLHFLKFAKHTNIEVDGVPVRIHRLGMSGALAYEMHGDMRFVEQVFDAIYQAGKDLGIRKLGYASYTRNHTQGGYPNQYIHFWYARLQSGEDQKNFYLSVPFELQGTPFSNDFSRFIGSAADDPVNALVTLYDVNWEYLIDWDHDFIGKEALRRLDANPPRTAVTLVWDREDVGRAFAAQVYDPEASPADDISRTGDSVDMPMALSYVEKDGERVGVATGRIIDYYHHSMISLCWLKRDLAEPGTEVEVIWGTNPACQTRIKAIVAKMPYYDEKWRNETCDVEKLVPHPAYE